MQLLSSSIRDWRLSEFFIDLLPVEYAINLIKFLEQNKKEYFNALSTTSAFGWSSLMNSFGGDKKISWQMLLPVADSEQAKSTLKPGFNQPTERTIKVLKRLLNQNRLPLSVQLDIYATGVLEASDN